MRREIDDQQVPAAAQHARRLGDHAVGFVREMERLMDDDAVGAGVGKRQVQEIPLNQVYRQRLARQFRARDAEHFGAAIERGDPARGGRENLRHPARSRTDVEEMTEPAIVHHCEHRGLDLALGDMARPDRIPFGGMFGEIALGRRRALVAHRSQPARIVRDHQRLAHRKGPAARLRDDIGDGPLFDDPQEHPAPLAPPLDNPCLGEDADVARNARLALVEHRGQLADRQFHLAQQRDDPQARGVRKGAKNVEQLGHIFTYKAFFISGQPARKPRFPPLANRQARNYDKWRASLQKGHCTPFGEAVILPAIGKFTGSIGSHAGRSVQTERGIPI